jgi:flagellar protein FliO/FliZ
MTRPRLPVGRLALGVTILALAGSLSAAAAAAEPAPARPAKTSATSSRPWLRPTAPSKAPSAAPASAGKRGLLFGGVVLVAIVAGVLYHRRRKNTPAPVRQRSRIQVLGSSQVGPKARAVVVSAGGRLMLLGVTDQSVVKLAWLGSAEAAAEEAPAVASRHEPEPAIEPAALIRKNGFRELFSDALGIGLEPKAEQSAAAEIARQTTDRFESSSRPKRIEGQAAGLIARLEGSVR